MAKRKGTKSTAGQFVNLQGVTNGSAGIQCPRFGVPARCWSHPKSHALPQTGQPWDEKGDGKLLIV